jgi:iron-sulfur cluster repair protein YtfE (RIC family)
MSDLTISTYYEADHDRLDGLFKDFQRHKNSDPSASAALLQEFSDKLRRHIAWEEEILFAMFEQRNGVHGGGPTHVMRREHQDILKHLDAIVEKMLAGDPESGYDEQMLLNILAVHNLKEEQVLYPWIDRLLTDGDRSRVFAKMKEYIPKGAHTQ